MTYGTASTRITPPTAEDYALAKQVAEWLGTLAENEQSSDYLYNLGIYGKAGVVNAKGMGIVASAPQAFNRELAKRANSSSRDQAVSKHVGKEGERLTLKVRLVAIHDSWGTFGATYIHKFEVAEGLDAGACLTWFGSNHLRTVVAEREGLYGPEVNHKPGDIFWVKGTVKRHGEFKEVKETTLSRVDVVLDPEEAKAQKAAAAKAKREATKAAKAAAKAAEANQGVQI